MRNNCLSSTSIIVLVLATACWGIADVLVGRFARTFVQSSEWTSRP
jgi:hypothetical protein